MRQAAQPHPRLTWVDATAEHTTLPDASVDVVTAFQAWHWFDPDAVAAEARRILRPGGRLAIVYNERDERDPFTAAYGDLVRRYATDATEQRRSTAALGKAAGIDPALTVREEFRNTHPLDRAGLHARARSTSYLPREGPEADALHARIDAIFDRFATADEIPMHLVTSVTRVGFS
jgi:SAM-dependent methyltransferase